MKLTDETLSQDEKYKEISHTWTDIFDDDKEKTVGARFRRPSAAQIKRLQATAGKNAGAAAERLLLDIVHPDDSENFVKALAQFPVLVATFSGVILKSCGLADLGN